MVRRSIITFQTSKSYIVNVKTLHHFSSKKKKISRNSVIKARSLSSRLMRISQLSARMQVKGLCRTRYLSHDVYPTWGRGDLVLQNGFFKSIDSKAGRPPRKLHGLEERTSSVASHNKYQYNTLQIQPRNLVIVEHYSNLSKLKWLGNQLGQELSQFPEA